MLIHLIESEWYFTHRQPCAHVRLAWAWAWIWQDMCIISSQDRYPFDSFFLIRWFIFMRLIFSFSSKWNFCFPFLVELGILNSNSSLWQLSINLIFKRNVKYWDFFHKINFAISKSKFSKVIQWHIWLSLSKVVYEL